MSGECEPQAEVLNFAGTTNAATRNATPAPVTVAAGPLVSKSHPPAPAPTVIATWMAAT